MILHSFVEALLAACVAAISSWPLYRRFTARLPRRMPRTVASLIFTCLITVFVLAPFVFAIGALLTEANQTLFELVAAYKRGLAVPEWLENVPLLGSWAAARWKTELAQPGAVSLLAQRTDLTAFLGWAQSFGHFMGRHAFIVLFTVLLLFFLYQEGENLADGFRRALRHWIGERAEGYVDLATRAVRASVNSMLLVGLFDGFATLIAYAILGVPHALQWAAITGTLTLVPFLGYVAATALAFKLVMTGASTLALVSFSVGCIILFCGDKIVRPVLAGDGTHLPFVWVLMGCLGGFEVLGLIGVVIGPVLLTLAREIWEQRVRDLVVADARDSASPVDYGA